MRLRHFIILCISGILVSSVSFGQGRDDHSQTHPRISAGLSFSPKGAGGEMLVHGRDNIVSHVRITTDFERIISGYGKTPGSRLSYYADFPILTTNLGKDGIFSMYSGPGLVGGYMRDNRKNFGFVGGLSAEFGVELSFRSPFVMRLSVSTDLAVHYTSNNKYDNTLTFYNNGIRNAWHPEFALLYAFGRRDGRNSCVQNARRTYSSDYQDNSNTHRRNKGDKPKGVSGSGLSIHGHRWSWGVEGSLIGNLLEYKDITYTNPRLGYIMHNPGKLGWTYHTNGEVLGHVAYSLTPRVSLGVVGGYSGITNDVRFYPLALRGSFAFKKSALQNGLQAFLELGSGVPENHNRGPVYTARLGYSYRVFASMHWAFEFGLGARVINYRPTGYVGKTDIRIKDADLRSATGWAGALTVFLGISFR